MLAFGGCLDFFGGQNLHAVLFQGGKGFAPHVDELAIRRLVLVSPGGHASGLRRAAVFVHVVQDLLATGRKLVAQLLADPANAPPHPSGLFLDCIEFPIALDLIAKVSHIGGQLIAVDLVGGHAVAIHLYRVEGAPLVVHALRHPIDKHVSVDVWLKRPGG